MPDRLYIDESGDHTTSHPTDIGKRYLGLVGVHFQPQAAERFRVDLEQFKREQLDYDDDDPPILHREDIVSRSGPFHVLRDDNRKRKFDAALLELVVGSGCKIVAVVIDKLQHGERTYRQLVHPYHYCIHAMMERYCGLLDIAVRTGDVMAESRGGCEDAALKRVYEDIWSRGTRYCEPDKCKRTLTSKQIKLKRKEANIAGLQLADILAHPLTRDVLYAHRRIEKRGGYYLEKLCEKALPLYNRQVYDGRINGYGRVMLS